jgi:hypothetical protein
MVKYCYVIPKIYPDSIWLNIMAKNVMLSKAEN